MDATASDLTADVPGAVVRLNVPRFIEIAATRRNADGSDPRWTRPARAGEAPSHNGRTVSVRRVAEDIGCQPSTLSRILRGERACGGSFIANVLAAIEPAHGFADVFIVVHAGDEAA